MALFDLIARLRLDGSGFESGLRHANKASERLKAQLLSAFSVTAITLAAKKTMEYAGHITDLSEALGIDRRRHVFLATIFTECIKNDDSAVDSVKTVLDLRHDGKINDAETAFLIFDFGWFMALNAASREIEKQIMGSMMFDKTTGEMTDA